MKNNLLILLAIISLSWLAMGGCEPRYEVLKNEWLDMVPVLAEISDGNTGYAPGEIVLVLLPAAPGEARVTRGIADVLAVYQDSGRKWIAPAGRQSRRITPFQFSLPKPIGVDMNAGIFLPTKLGLRSELIPDKALKTSWVRASSSGKFINLEVGFATTPETVRKASYRVEPDAAAIVLESGALLQIGKK